MADEVREGAPAQSFPAVSDPSGSVPAYKEVVLCGGSHLAAVGVLPTQAFPLLLARRLRANGNPGCRVRAVRYDGNPRHLTGRDDLTSRQGYVLVLLTRNMYGLPLLPVVRRALVRRLTGRPAGDESSPPPAAGISSEGHRSKVGLLAGGCRWLLALGLAMLCLPALPLIVRDYGRRLDAALSELERRGCRGSVLTTPVRLPRREYPGARWYQRALARCIRRRAGARVQVADLFTRLAELSDDRRMLPNDPFHLTAEGHRLLAEEVFAAVERLAARLG